MYTYVITLRPVVAAGGIEGLDENRKKMFEGILLFASKFLETAQEVDEVTMTEDYALIVKANSEVYDMLKNISENVIVTQLKQR
jgi:hypothetical protein